MERQELVALYAALEAQRKIRDKLALYLMMYGGLLLMMPFIPMRVWRLFGAVSYFIAWFVIALVIAGAGLWLLVKFLYNVKAIHDLKEAITYAKTASPRPETRYRRYILGDDGELIPEAEADDRHLKTDTPVRKRIQL